MQGLGPRRKKRGVKPRGQAPSIPTMMRKIDRPRRQRGGLAVPQGPKAGEPIVLAEAVTTRT